MGRALHRHFHESGYMLRTYTRVSVDVTPAVQAQCRNIRLAKEPVPLHPIYGICPKEEQKLERNGLTA